MADRSRRAGPDRAQLLAAADRTVPPVLAPGLRVLFCGINPGLYTAWTGHHFARPGNRFWPALHRSGFTGRQLAPAEQDQLLDLGLGVTNIASRASARADELTRDELRAGAARLTEEVGTYRPRWLAVLGITAYRKAFEAPRAALGPQDARVGPTRVWVLPNPSGLNAHHTPASLAQLFGELRAAVERDDRQHTLVVDVANVVGSRPDGWWRDRVGATHRLLVQLAGADLGHVVAVVEGQARAVEDTPGIEVVRAAGSGDDEVVAQVTRRTTRCTVVTADRGLVLRLPSGTPVTGPGSLLRGLDPQR